MRIPQTKEQKIKAGVHIAQGTLIFISGCLTIAVMTKQGGIGGATGFSFALCFLSIPAIIYQIMVPMWTRAWRFANVYAYAAIDIVFAILWFAASIAVGVWNANGIAQGAEDGSKKDDTSKPPGKRNDHSSSCDTFAWGDTTKCNTSKASVGLGVLIFLLFGVTAWLAIQQVLVYRRTGIMPNGHHKSSHGPVAHADSDDANKDARSANVDELEQHDHEHILSHVRSDDRLRFGQEMEEDEQGLLRHQVSHQRLDSRDEDGLAHPGRQLSYKSSNEPQTYDDYRAPSALSPTTAYEPHGPARVQFPSGNY